MSELETQIANRVANNSDLNGAQDLIDAHIDAVNGGLVIYHINFDSIVSPFPPHPGPIRLT
jgi:hypothetical protein